MENRLQAITEHLIQKQNQLETLASEKAYLQLQLEAALQQNQMNKNVVDDRHSIVIDDGSTLSNKKRSKRSKSDDLRSIASLMESSPISHHSALRRRVVGAANFLDSVSTVTGRFLGQAPIARLAVIFYMVHTYLHFSINDQHS